MNWFLQRLNEPSSYAGLSAMIGAVAAGVSGGMPPTVAAVQGLAGLLAFAHPEAAQKPAGQ